MKRYKYILPVLAAITLFLGACKKEGSNIFNMFEGVTIDVHNSNPEDVVDTKTVNDGDNVSFNYTITSDQDMYGISILEVGTNTPIRKVVLTDAQRRSFSEVYKFVANNRVGPTSYRIYATDKVGVYMGDGHKVFTININNNFDFNPEQHVDLGDSSVVDAGATLTTPPTTTYTARTAAKSFYSLNDVKAYNYADAKANATNIDFGIYAKTTTSKNTTTGVVTVTYNYYAYSPTTVATTFLPFTGFDFSTWTKHDTKFVLTTQNSATFVTLKTGTQIITAAVAAKPTGTSCEIKAGSTFYALTPDGRYAAIYVDKIGYDHIYGYYANFFIKYAYKK
ncbi:hypothetical protein HQ865_13460 [Mucilaginibacter mali]|uniref:Uncharacterized protein n=1 Tax=Mucilaginibacter mali TaxID=2740462 RepID=A0A7D4UBH2_9SPHI|nr:hypothetical protein [Mucilaginibacter mali]QKJ30718.1 hypothetical protein HQ865_13460 [Mucilaginibacter mali]